MLTKFCLLLNEKKSIIADLKAGRPINRKLPDYEDIRDEI